MLQEVIGDISDWVGVASIAGFGFTIWQLIRTKSAVDAAESAIQRTEQHLAVNQLLIVIPQLESVEGELTAAMESGDRRAAARQLVSWRKLVSEVIGLSADQPFSEDELEEILSASTTSASLAKARVLKLEDGGDVAKALGTAVRDIDAVMEVIARLSGRLRRYSGPSEVK